MRCITEKSKGFGNFSRCLTLAKGLQKKGYDVVFIINNNNTIKQKLFENKFSYVLIQDYDSISKESLKLQTFPKSNEILILDMREKGESLSRHLHKFGKNVVLLDDAWGKNAYADIIINGTPIKKYCTYKKLNSNSKIFSGIKYWMFNPEFKKFQKKVIELRPKKYHNVIISMGGSDPKFFTELLMKNFLNDPRIFLTIIIGPFFTHQKKLEKLIIGKKNIKIIYSPEKLWKFFSFADLIISSAGNTLFETCALKIPTISIPVLKHQIPYSEYFSSKGFSLNIKTPFQFNSKKTQNQINIILENYQKRKKIWFSAKNTIDLEGLNRVIKIIENFQKKLDK